MIKFHDKISVIEFIAFFYHSREENSKSYQTRTYRNKIRHLNKCEVRFFQLQWRNLGALLCNFFIS